MPTRWAPNPIALARLALGRAQPRPDSWSAVEALFGAAYKADARSVFYGSGDAPALIDLIDQAADQVPKPLPLRSILAVPAVRTLANRLSNPEWLARLLPFIVPVSDMGFGPPGTGFETTEHPQIGAYEQIGALEVDGVSWLDPEQGCTSDCYLIAAMISIAWARPMSWRAALSVAAQSKEPPMLHIVFHDESDGQPDHDPIDMPPRVPLDPGHNWIYAHSAQHEETWPALIERAFVMQVRNCPSSEPTVDDYREIGNKRFAHQAARMLMGGSTFFHVATLHSKPFDMVVDCCEQSLVKNPTIASTLAEPVQGVPGGDFAESKLVRNHAYAVLGLMAGGEGNFVVLRNPVGQNDHIADSPSGAWNTGATRNGGVAVPLDQNGVFAISEQRFNACFQAVDGIDLAADPEEH